MEEYVAEEQFVVISDKQSIVDILVRERTCNMQEEVSFKEKSLLKKHAISF